MQYITNVKDNGSTKHIISVAGKNVEVIERELTKYGETKGMAGYHFANVSVCKETFKFLVVNNSLNLIHLADVVLCIEISKFIAESGK